MIDLQVSSTLPKARHFSENLVAAIELSVQSFLYEISFLFIEKVLSSFILPIGTPRESSSHRASFL